MCKNNGREGNDGGGEGGMGVVGCFWSVQSWLFGECRRRAIVLEVSWFCLLQTNARFEKQNTQCMGGGEGGRCMYVKHNGFASV